MVRLHVVSDVHGEYAALANAGDGADVLICLGDLILFVDYEDHANGIFADLFGQEACSRYIALRTQGRFDEARALGDALWQERGGNRRAHIDAAVRGQYERLFTALPEPALLTYGNVDVPGLWPEFVKPGHRVLDGEVVEIDGVRIGFVGGGLRTPMRTPFEITDEDFAAKVDALGEVDILCSHIPPALPELTYDTVARRFERGSAALLAAIVRHQPRYALFGHVHQPLARRTRVGRTECLNVGHFHSRRTPFVLEV